MMTGMHSTSPRKPQLGLFQDDPLFHGAQLAIRVLGAAAWSSQDSALQEAPF